jgi:serine/threonine-protein kinase
LIGEGGFAWVFEAHREDQTDPVALKILKHRYAGDPEFEARFRNEFTTASDLLHPNLVRILDVGRSGNLTYFAMPLYPDSLASQIERDGPLPEGRLIQIAAQVAAGLSFAHGRGIVHRDIKGDNVLLDTDGNAVIADFGTARAVSEYVTATGVNMTLGTPHYISPEQAQGRRVDGRSDLYSLGVTLYKAATGDVPFRSTDWFELARMHVEEKPYPPRKKRPELSRRFERVIVRCLAKHPDDRYPSADDLLKELSQVATDDRGTSSFGLAPPTTAEIKQESRGSGSRYGWLLGVGAVALIILVAALVVLLGR